MKAKLLNTKFGRLFVLLLFCFCWSCGAGGIDENQPLPGSATESIPTLATPRVIEVPRPNIPHPETTTRPTFRAETTTTTARTFQSYVIQDGESLSVIANRFPGVSVEDILAINRGLGDGSRVFPGQEIRIPIPQ